LEIIHFIWYNSHCFSDVAVYIKNERNTFLMKKLFSIQTFIWFSISLVGTILSKIFFPDFEIIIPVLFGYYVTNILNKNGTIAKLVLAILKLIKIK